MRTMNKSWIACAAIALAVPGCDSTSGDSSTATPTTAAPATAAPATGLPEGSYRTPALTMDQLTAAAVAAGFAQPETERALAEADLTTSAIYTIRLFAGGWTLLVGHDGAPAELGMESKYTVVDDHTVIFTDSCGAITYDYSMQGDQLSLRVVTDECPGRGELLTQTFIYQTAPFVRIGAGPPPTAGTAAASSYASTSFAVPFGVVGVHRLA